MTVQFHQNTCEQNPINSGESSGQYISSDGKITIYILSLECGRYYIGKSSTIDFRLEQHFADGGSSWTKKYNL